MRTPDVYLYAAKRAGYYFKDMYTTQRTPIGQNYQRILLQKTGVVPSYKPNVFIHNIIRTLKHAINTSKAIYDMKQIGK